MPISKRAKTRFKLATRSEKTAVAKAAKTLYDFELLGPKRARDIERWARKYC